MVNEQFMNNVIQDSIRKSKVKKNPDMYDRLQQAFESLKSAFTSMENANQMFLENRTRDNAVTLYGQADDLEEACKKYIELAYTFAEIMKE